eukprot:2675631-Pleurochrysis_carterae.AAC.1
MWSNVAALLTAAAAGEGAAFQPNNDYTSPSPPQSSSVHAAAGVSARSCFGANGGASSSRNKGERGADACAGGV